MVHVVAKIKDILSLIFICRSKISIRSARSNLFSDFLLLKKLQSYPKQNNIIQEQILRQSAKPNKQSFCLRKLTNYFLETVYVLPWFHKFTFTSHHKRPASRTRSLILLKKYRRKQNFTARCFCACLFSLIGARIPRQVRFTYETGRPICIQYKNHVTHYAVDQIRCWDGIDLVFLANILLQEYLHSLV